MPGENPDFGHARHGKPAAQMRSSSPAVIRVQFGCGHKLKPSAVRTGKTGRCPSCGGKVRVPA